MKSIQAGQLPPRMGGFDLRTGIQMLFDPPEDTGNLEPDPSNMTMGYDELSDPIRMDDDVKLGVG